MRCLPERMAGGLTGQAIPDEFGHVRAMVFTLRGHRDEAIRVGKPSHTSG